MNRKRARIIVEVDLDPVYGTFHEAEDHVKVIQRHLNDMYEWYHPTVKLDTVIEPTVAGEYLPESHECVTSCVHLVPEDAIDGKAPLTEQQWDRICDYLSFAQQVNRTDLHIEDGYIHTKIGSVAERHSIYGDSRIGCIKTETWNTAIINRPNGYAVINFDGSMRFMDGWYYNHKGERVH